jgi:hypothetical protein
LATAGAALYLATHWRGMAKKYKNAGTFCVVLRFPSSDPKQYEILFER